MNQNDKYIKINNQNILLTDLTNSMVEEYTNDLATFQNTFIKLFDIKKDYEDTDAISTKFFNCLGIHNVKEEYVDLFNEVILNKTWDDINSVESIVLILESINKIYTTIFEREIGIEYASIEDYKAINIMGVNEKNIALINNILIGTLRKNDFNIQTMQQVINKTNIHLSCINSISCEEMPKEKVFNYLLEDEDLIDFSALREIFGKSN